MRSVHVVTGGHGGIGRAIVDRLLDDGAAVVVIDRQPGPPRTGLVTVVGDAADEAVTERAADEAESVGRLAGWVNNAAIFADASLLTSPANAVLDLISANLGLALAGCATAVRRMRAGGGGAIVNVSSHQARRPVAGALPYATAKAAIEGLTRALAVEHGRDGIRVNAVALGSIRTDRYDALVAEPGAAVDAEMARLHPLGRVGEAREVAAVVAHLLSPDAAFVTGVVLPVDGGRAALGQDPEARVDPGPSRSCGG